jgi:hypothetical protein
MFSMKYSLIVCNGVLEHTPYPSDLLFDIITIMSTDSTLYIEVPLENIILNERGNLHLKKKHWHEHINFFSEKSLSVLINNVGLEIIGLNKLQANFAGSARYAFQIACRLAPSEQISNRKNL